MDGLGKGNSISEFLLDSRNPGGVGGASDYAEEERQREADADRQVGELLKETRVWRAANSATWVAWGIVQAKVPELDEKNTIVAGAEQTEEPATIENGVNGLTAGLHHTDLKENKRPEGLKAEALLQGDSVKEADQLDDEDEFDYLAYAQDRALFFWGDMVSIGIVKREELTENLVQRMKFVEY
jgi:choline kinase